MAVQLVSDIYDISALTAQHEQFIALLKESKASIIDLNKQRITVKGSSLAEFTKETQELNKAINAGTEATNKAAVAKDNLTKKTLDQIKIDKNQVILDREKIKAKQEDEKLDQQKLRTKQQTIKTSAEELRQKAIEETLIKKVSAEKTKLEGNIQKEIKSQEKLSSEYQQLQQRYIIAANTAKNLAAAELQVVAAQGKESAAAKQAAIDTKMAADAAANYHVQLLKIDQSVGQSQRNVGNYTSATFALTQVIREAPAFANSFATGISGISNNIPMLLDQFKLLRAQVGSNFAAFKILAASLLSFQALLPIGFLLIQSYGKEIASFFSNMFSGSKVIDEVAIKQKALNEVTKSLNEEYIKGTTAQLIHMERLREVLTDRTRLDKERALALEEYNKIADHANQIDIKNLNNINLVNDSISRQIDLIERRALATASEKILSERAEKFLLAEEKAREKAMKDQNNEEMSSLMMMYDWNNKMLRKMGKEELTYEEYKARQKEGIFATYERNAAINRKIAKDDEVRQTKAEFEAAKEMYRKNMDAVPFTTKKDTYKKPAKEKKVPTDTFQALKEEKDAEFEVYKIHQEALLRQYDNEINDERTHYLAKLTALNNYVKARKDLLDREEAEEIANAKEAAAREIQHLQESKAGKSKAEKARIDENIKISEKNLTQDLLLIQTTYADKNIQNIEEAGKKRQDIIDNQHKTELKNYEEFKKLMEDAEKKDDDRIKEGFKKRAEQEKEYNALRLKMEKELRDAKLELALDGEDFLFNLMTAGIERAQNLIQQQKEEVDKQKANALLANDQLVQSEQDKAANIAIINSRAQIQKEALDRKNAELEYRKAQFSRAQQIFEIGIQTIKTIAAIKLKVPELAIEAIANPLKLKLIPLALSQIPIALASSALSIAAVFAKPIPRYKGGRGEGKEEWAITGDGGVPEYIHRADGTIQKTPAVETITHLMPSDKVYKDEATMRRELAMSAIPMSNYVVNPSGGIDKADMEKMTGRIEEAVGNIQINTLLITKEGWREQNKRLAEYNSWVENVVKQ